MSVIWLMRKGIKATYENLIHYSKVEKDVEIVKHIINIIEKQYIDDNKGIQEYLDDDCGNAIFRLEENDEKECLKFIFDNFKDIQERHLMRAIYIQEEEMILFHVENKYDLNFLDKEIENYSYDKTALSAAMEFNSIETIKLLIDNGADIYMKNGNGTLPIHEAVAMNNQEALELLVELGVDINTRCSKGKSVLHYTNYDLDVELKMFNYILDKGLDINSIDNNGGNILHNEDLEIDNELLNLFIKKGINVNHQDKDGNTPLHIAYRYGDKYKIKTLIPFSNTRIKNNDGLYYDNMDLKFDCTSDEE